MKKLVLLLLMFTSSIGTFSNESSPKTELDRYYHMINYGCGYTEVGFLFPPSFDQVIEIAEFLNATRCFGENRG